VLGAVLFVAVLFGGVPSFTGPRWVPGANDAPPQNLPSFGPMRTTQPEPPGAASPVAPLVIAVLLALGGAAILWFVLRALLRARGRGTTLPPLGDAAEPAPPPLPADATVDSEPDAPIVHRGLRLALEALDEGREPADAVVKAWLGLQSAAEESGVERRPAETPTEFTSRVITRVQADAAAAAQLVDVYQAVRFGGHPITPVDVRAARVAIEKLLSSWHEPILRRRR
jgi:hypothetical protein